MKKKILISILVLVVLGGGIYAGLSMNSEGGMGFIRRSSVVQKKIDNLSVVQNPSNLNTVNQIKEINNINTINDVKIVEKDFELLDPGQVFDDLVEKPISFKFNNSSLYRLIGQYNNEISSFYVNMCSTSLCAVYYEPITMDNPLPPFERITLNQVTNLSHNDEYYRLTLKNIDPSKQEVIEVSNLINSDYTNYAIPLRLALETSDASGVDFASDSFAIDSTIKLSACTISATKSCTFVYTDSGNSAKSVNLKVGENIILQTNSTSAYRVTLMSVAAIEDGEYSAVVKVEKRG